MRVKNWKKFQHFKDRRPPWVKLHRDILDHRDIMTISSCSFRLLTLFWLLASEDDSMEGMLPSIPDISFRIRMPEAEILKLLPELTPWIDDIDITPISSRYHNGLPETETETEAYKPETEEEEKKSVETGKKTVPKAHKITDAEWLDQIKANPAYQGINIDVETGKAQAWAMTKGRKCSRAFLLNWFNRAEKPIAVNGQVDRPRSFREQVNRAAGDAFERGEY